MCKHIFSAFVLTMAAVLAASPAAAELKITTESGVSVTRGVVAEKQPYAEDSVSLHMSLPEDYRGQTFGQRRLLVDGKYIYRAHEQTSWWCTRRCYCL